MNALVINTYGGSLLLGAKAAKANVIATMEDTGFGSDLQAINFPKVSRYEKRADWPEKFATPWRDIDAVAHPPCSAFSVQNSKSAATRGINTGAFACHRAVMDYALGHGVRTLVIESVLGAYEAASEAYEQVAGQYSYRTNYVMLNSAAFGVPQWRPRLWVVFHKCKTFKVAYKPQWAVVNDILDASGTPTPFPNGFATNVFAAFSKHITRDWYGNVYKQARLRLDDNSASSIEDFCAQYKIGRPFESNAPFLLDGAGFAPTLVLTSSWLDYTGRKPRLLTIEEYCAIMGFPRDYKWGKQIKKFRLYLSKGVCPPVAAWIMKQVDKNASGWTGTFTHEESDFGGVIDLRIKKQEALALANGRPWLPAGAPKAARVPHGVRAAKLLRDPSLPRGHHYTIVDATKCVAPASPQAAFILAALKKAGKPGLTRDELVALAVKDPKGFPTNQPHDRAIGFFLSKFRTAGGLDFAE
jgi:site-specific DNA-cytosine methylase